jgi:protein-S-isoprenylcysteine O-methyltransferase Ste14
MLPRLFLPPGPVALLIHYTHTLYSYTILIHYTHTLYSYTILIHYTHTLYSYTILIHYTHTLYSYTIPGLWRYSRHPNHFGEQTWWIGLLLFGVAAKSAFWPICFGVCFNHPIDSFATLQLIEERMVSRPERVKAWEEYCKRTSMLVPLPPSSKARASKTQ